MLDEDVGALQALGGPDDGGDDARSDQERRQALPKQVFVETAQSLNSWQVARRAGSAYHSARRPESLRLLSKGGAPVAGVAFVKAIKPGRAGNDADRVHKIGIAGRGGDCRSRI
jgi:hypothetical protein